MSVAIPLPTNTGTAEIFAPRKWLLAHDRSLVLGEQARIMGVLNVTPDSFSDGGSFEDVDAALSRAQIMLEQGAVIIDVGGESTRPGATSLSAGEEQARVLPIIEALAQHSDAIISIDTYRAETARLAIAAGAHVINDVWGCQKEPDLAMVASQTGAGLCIMHTSRERECQTDVIEDQVEFLRRSLAIASDAGVADSAIVIDPGFGFGKDISVNLHLLDRLEELHALQFPMLVGTSRKGFLGLITGREPDQRGVATAATSVIARQKGAAIFRVHDIVENRDALAVADALIHSAMEGASNG